MAGPTVTILLRNKLSDVDKADIWREICDLSNHTDRDDFWIDERPFLWSCGEGYDGEFVETEYAECIVWTPRDAISFAAMCNDHEDHIKLAELALRFSRKFDGLVDYGGSLGATAGNLEGRLYTLEYTSANGRICENHISDTVFLDAWLKHVDFRMIK